MVKSLKTPGYWLIAVAVLALIAYVISIPNIPSREVSRTVSPEAATAAVLVDVPRDAAGSHSFKVCLQRPSTRTVSPANCNEVAYLAGVRPTIAEPAVRLVWTGPYQLDIRYANASSVQIYKPVYVWSSRSTFSGPRGNNLPIHVNAVPLGDSDVKK